MCGTGAVGLLFLHFEFRYCFEFRISDFGFSHMIQISLSTLAVILGLSMALPQIYGFISPTGFAAGVRKFPRSVAWGFALMILGTSWFLWNLSQESISDFASWKNVLIAGFAAVGIGTCIFVQDFLAVRGL